MLTAKEVSLCARIAGVLYLAIIVLGLFSEVCVRSALVVLGDPATTAQNILASESLFRVGFLTDSVMVLSDVGVAVLLFTLLEPVNTILALAALAFRLMQTAVISVNLLNYYAALLLLKSTASAFNSSQLNRLASLFLDLHSHGYDLGLIFFGIHCLILGYLIVQSWYLPQALGYLAMAAGITYLVGSYTRFLLPGFIEVVSPIYLIALFSELSLCLWLLMRGVDLECWQKEVDAPGIEAV